MTITTEPQDATLNSFVFSTIPSVQAEVERRACVLYGEDWRSSCKVSRGPVESEVGGRGVTDISSLLWKIIALSLDDRFASPPVFKHGQIFLYDQWSGQSLTSMAHQTNDFILYRRNEIRGYNGGFLSDLPDGSHALIAYHNNGGVRVSSHFANKALNDPADGTASHVEFYESGQMHSYRRYRDGHLHDSDDGDPSEVCFSEDGEITSGHSDDLGWRITPQEIEKRICVAQKAVQFRRVAALLPAVDTSVVPAGLPLEMVSYSAAAR